MIFWGKCSNEQESVFVQKFRKALKMIISNAKKNSNDCILFSPEDHSNYRGGVYMHHMHGTFVNDMQIFVSFFMKEIPNNAYVITCKDVVSSQLNAEFVNDCLILSYPQMTEQECDISFSELNELYALKQFINHQEHVHI